MSGVGRIVLIIVGSRLKIFLDKTNRSRAGLLRNFAQLDASSSPSVPRTAIEITVFGWFKPNRQRESILDDRNHLEVRARRLLKSYLSADSASKAAIYQVVAGAAAGCQPHISDPNLDGLKFAKACAEVAVDVIRLREQRAADDRDRLAALITDAYATVALAYRRASAAYTADQEMQKVGTAAVHLLTIATSYVAAQGIVHE
jgi:hypothetical protein